MRCALCQEDAIFYQPYSGAHLCSEHFMRSVERRAFQRVRETGMVGRCQHIAVALSGGKDSAACLHIMHTILTQNPRVKLSAILVDEGIEGYRSVTKAAADRLCRQLDVQLEKVSFQGQWSITLDEILERTGSERACAYCGVLRRWLLNRRAREIGAQALCTGHNLDDEAQTVLLDVLDDDVKRLVRLDHPKFTAGFVPRYKPLARVPEQEVALYAMLRGLPHASNTCPYSGSSARNDARELLMAYEDRHPGARHSLMRFYHRVLPSLADDLGKALESDTGAIGNCEKCGEPSVGKTCRACALLAGLEEAHRF